MNYDFKIIPCFVILLLTSVPVIGMGLAYELSDTIRPVVTNTTASDLTMACGDDYNALIAGWLSNDADLLASDNSDTVEIISTISEEEIISDLTTSIGSFCTNSESYAVGFFARDTCGNTSIDTIFATIRIVDNVRPVLLSVASDVAMDCTNDVQSSLDQWVQSFGGASAEDACTQDVDWFQFIWNDSRGNSSTGNPISGPFIPIQDGACNWSVTVSFFVRDLCGNNQVTTASFSIEDTIAPQFVNPMSDVSFACDQVDILSLTATDNCDLDPLVSFETIATDQSDDPDDCSYYNYNIERLWTVTDACGNSTTLLQNIAVVDTITPSFQVPPDITIFCESEIDTSLTGTPSNILDNCNSNLTLLFRDSGEINDCEYVISRFWQIADGCGSSNILPQLITVVDSAAPVITVPATDLILDCSSAEEISIQFDDWINNIAGATAEDACNTLEWFVAQPSSYDLNDQQTFPGTPIVNLFEFTCGGVTEENRSLDFVFYDVCGNASVTTASIVFSDSEAPKFLEERPDIEIVADSSCEQIINIVFPGVEDDCSADELILRSILLNGTSIRQDTSSFDTLLNIGQYEILYYIEDCVGNKDSLVQNIVIADTTAPVISCSEDITIEADELTCSTSFELFSNIEFSDNCDLAIVSYELISGSLTQTDTIDSLDVISMIDLEPGLNTLTYTFKDRSDNIATCSYQITIVDNFRPILSCTNDTIVLSIDELEDFTVNNASLLLLAEDNCELDSIIYSPGAIDCNSLGPVNEITIRAVDISGNSTSCTANLFVILDTLTVTFDLGVCSGDSLRLFSNVDFSEDLFVDWVGPNGFISTEVNPIIPEPDESHAGLYQVTITNIGGCFTTGEVAVNISEEEFPVLNTNSGIICDGEDLLLSTREYTGEVMYEWFEGVIPDGLLIATTGSGSLSITPEVGEYFYYVTVNSANCGSISSSPVGVEVATKPQVELLNESITICEGETFEIGVLQAEEGLNYSWTGPNAFEANVPTPPIFENATAEESGIYVLVSSIGSCEADTLSVEVIVGGGLTAAEISGTRNICLGDSIILRAEGFVSAVDSFIWTTPIGVVILEEPDFIIPNSDDDDIGSYSLQIKEDDCISPASNTIAVNIASDILAPTITSQGPFCLGQTIQLFADFIPDANYEWRGPNNFSATNVSPLIFNINENFAGSYEVRVNFGGCISDWSAPFVLELIDARLMPIIESEPLSICKSAINLNVEICLTEGSFVPDLQYIWMLENDGDTLLVSNSRCINLTEFDKFQDGENRIVVVGITGECVSAFSDELIITSTSDISGASINAGEDIFTCSTSLDIQASGPTNGIWTDPTGELDISDASATGTTIADLQEGENILIWTVSEDECSAGGSDSLVVFVETQPQLEDDEFDLSTTEPIEIDIVSNDEVPNDFIINIISVSDGLIIDTEDPFAVIAQLGEQPVGQAQFEYEICNFECLDMCDRAVVTFKLGELKLCDATNVITPNGDGINDKFIIPCLESNAFPGNAITIFNQYGDEVFAAEPYENNWEGTYGSEELPVGTYFYILSLGLEGVFEDGFIQLER